MQRRSFLMGTMLPAAQAVWAQSNAAQQQPQVGTGMIGVGGRGSYLLSGVMLQPNARVVALCDIKPDRLDKAATAAGKQNPSTTSDWHKILERKDIDAVFIATPPYLHAEMAIAALKAGKNVYCEKPIGLTPASIRELVQAARSTKKVFQAGQQMRSYKQMGEAVRKIHAGDIGDILFVKSQRHARTDLSHEGTSGDWYFDYKKSGGYLVEQSVHNLDACNWAIGAHPTRATGFGGTTMYKNDPPGRDIMDHASITYDYPKGVQMSFTQLVFHPQGLPGGGQSTIIYGSKGAVDLVNPAIWYPAGDKEKPTPFSPKVEEDPHAHIAAFYKCVQEGAASPADITIGATAALTAILGSEACRQGKVINWSDMGVTL